VVKEVVAAREAMAGDSTLAVAEVTEMRSCTVTVHTVGLALVAKETGGGGELNADASLLVASEWLQVGVDILAGSMLDEVAWHSARINLLVVALQRCWLVAAARIALLWAVVFAILVWHSLVQWVAASDLGALFFELQLSCVRRRHYIFVFFEGLCWDGSGCVLFGVCACVQKARRVKFDVLREVNARSAGWCSNESTKGGIVCGRTP
jgi:hypothetical protein